MEFVQWDFDALNETDVREEIVSPLLKHLGYRAGTEHNILRELTLTYDRNSLGRRKATDPALRGRADYICDAGGRVRWVIETKPPSESITTLAAEQAWTYAAHPQIRAVYFCLTNGREFRLYQTNNGPDHPAVFVEAYEGLKDRMVGLENLLRPEALLRAYPEVELDYGLPIGLGLRSICRITHGFVKPDADPGIPALLTAGSMFAGGTLERVADRLVATLSHPSSNEAFDKLRVTYGPGDLTMSSEASVLSSDPAKPTVFRGRSDIRIPAGTSLPAMIFAGNITMPFEIAISESIVAEGYLNERVFSGRYRNTVNSSPRPGAAPTAQRSAGSLQMVPHFLGAAVAMGQDIRQPRFPQRPPPATGLIGHRNPFGNVPNPRVQSGTFEIHLS